VFEIEKVVLFLGQGAKQRGLFSGCLTSAWVRGKELWPRGGAD